MAQRYASFEDRGVYVGFQTRRVEMCRVRIPKADLDDYEALIPNWAGRESQVSNDLIMSLMDVPNWCQLSERDAHLHTLIESRRTRAGGHLDPIMMREIRLNTDLEYGEEIDRKLAEHELAIAAMDAQHAFLEILAMFGRNYAADVGIEVMRQVNRKVLLTLAEESSESLKRLIRVLGRTVAQRVGMTRELLQERLDVLSTFAAPICSIVTDDNSREVGFLSRQQGMLEDMLTTMLEYAKGRKRETREMASVIDLNASTFIEYAQSRAQAIQSALLSEHYYIRDADYKKLLDLVAAERVKISYALDGWAGHASRWMAVMDADPEVRDQVIGYILKDMPSATKNVEEEVAERMQSNAAVMSLRNKLVKEMHSWMDDSLDKSLYDRVIQARTDQDTKRGGIGETARTNPLVPDKNGGPGRGKDGISEIVKSAIAYNKPE